jgi:hypothetical protein
MEEMEEQFNQVQLLPLLLVTLEMFMDLLLPSVSAAVVAMLPLLEQRNREGLVDYMVAVVVAVGLLLMELEMTLGVAAMEVTELQSLQHTFNYD